MAPISARALVIGVDQGEYRGAQQNSSEDFSQNGRLMKALTHLRQEFSGRKHEEEF
jgi:hypothetical protein